MAQLTIDLDPKTLRALMVLAVQDGTSPEEILANFAGDLTGTDRRGSDEEDLARAYYERCDYYAERISFPAFMLRAYGLDGLREIRSSLRELREIREDLKAETDPEALKEIREAEAEELRLLKEYYSEYAERRSDPEPMAAALSEAEELLGVLEGIA